MFYTYRQNNSGGVFDYNKKDGITTFVVVEADSAEEADKRAEDFGMYFDGVDSGRDCECCGDRWYPASTDAGTEVPEIYGVAAREYKPLMKWQDSKKKETCIHFANGKKEWL